MKTDTTIPLTAPEIANLWSGYHGDTLARCVFTHFAKTAEDAEIKELLLYALELSNKHIKRLQAFFDSEGIPVPIAFSDEDLNIEAPRLYSDSFYLGYVMNFGKQGMAIYAYALPVTSRKDIREYFTECLVSATEILNRSIDLLESKGIYVRPPHIPVQNTQEFVHKESYFYALFGDRRPVNGPEIAHLYANIVTNLLGKALIQGFAQAAPSQDIRDWFLRGRDISGKHIEVFSSILRDDNLPAPNIWDDGVTTSTIAPFSEKLMMYHIGGLNVFGATNYGVALPSSTRRDLAVMYGRLLAEIGKYGEDGIELMLKHHWLEKVPGAVDRDKITAQ